MIQTFEVTVTFFLGKREKNMTKGGVNSLRGKHGNKHSKPMEMEGS